MNVIIILKIFSIPSHLMVCRWMSSESRSIVPLFSIIIWTRSVVCAIELIWLSAPVDKHIIDAEIVSGTHAGDMVFIPRILMSPSKDLSLLFKFKKKQFPMRLSFTMTINKAQG
jgi:hypothetical protein